MTADPKIIERKYFLPYQNNWITDDSKCKLWDKSRRIGATYAESYRACRKRNLIDYKLDYWFSSADESAAYEYASYCKVWCEMLEAAVKEMLIELEDDKGYRYNNYVIEFPTGSRINCLSSNPRRFRSKGGDICLDEFDHHDDPVEMLKAAMPATTWDFDVSILTTRNGEGTVFDKLVNQVKSVLRGETTFKKLNILPWSYHFTPITVAVEQGLAEKIKRLDHIDEKARQDFIDACRARAGSEDAFNQEYMCIPSAESSTLISYDMYQACEMDNCFAPPQAGGIYFGGVDVGREHDLTVLWISQLLGDVLIPRRITRLRKMPYPDQEKIITDDLRAYRVQRSCIDANGIGDPLSEYLQRTFGTFAVEKYKFTNPSKEHLASQILASIQDIRFRVPADRDTRESFHSIKKTVTTSNNTRYDAIRTEAGHADEFWAAALSREAATLGSATPQVIWL